MYRLELGLGLRTGNGLYPFFSALKSDEHQYVAMTLVAIWCVTNCGFHPAPTSPTSSVNRVTGDMKRRESNETRKIISHELAIDTEDWRVT